MGQTPFAPAQLARYRFCAQGLWFLRKGTSSLVPPEARKIERLRPLKGFGFLCARFGLKRLNTEATERPRALRVKACEPQRTQRRSHG